jgi:hypothetical protein
MPGGYGRGKRNRCRYNETGLPERMRNRFDLGYDPRYGPGYEVIPAERLPPFHPSPIGHPPYLTGREPSMTPKDELRMLEEEELILEDELEEIKKRIIELKKEVK